MLTQELDDLLTVSFARDTQRRVAEFVRCLDLAVCSGSKQKLDGFKARSVRNSHVQRRGSVRICGLYVRTRF